MITIKGLTFSYDNSPIFEELHFASKTRFVVIKGPSGSGKTTLLKLLTGNLEPTSMEQNPAADFKKKTLILQEDALFPWMTGIENILSVPSLSIETAQRHPLFAHVAPYVARYAYEMSYGQRRMVELFRAILYAPDLLCLDEPFNFLDPRNRKYFLDYLLSEDSSLSHSTIVMSTHYNEDTTCLALETAYVTGKFPMKRLLSESEFKAYA